MSGKPRASVSEFLQAAQAVDAELAQFERAVEAIRHIALDSAKGLERAGQSLTQVTQIEQRLSDAMQALSRTLTEAHARQQAQAQQAPERAQAIAVRTAELQKLMEGYQALGAAASALNSEAVELVARKKALGDRPDAELTGDIATLQEKLSQVAQIAQQLLDACRTAGFEDVARQVDSVRQQLLAAHKKLSLFVRSLAT
jgi:chromosome segregation ATPase